MNNNLNKAKATAVKREKTSQTIKQKKSNVKLNKKKIKRSLKKPIILCAVIFFVIGIVGGFFAINYLTKNDCFVMTKYSNGETDISIGAGEEYSSYQEIGVKCIAFNKDISSSVKIEYFYREDITKDYTQVSGVDCEKSGIYYVTYTVDNIKYKTVKLIRNVIVTREEI